MGWHRTESGVTDGSLYETPDLSIAVSKNDGHIPTRFENAGRLSESATQKRLVALGGSAFFPPSPVHDGLCCVLRNFFKPSFVQQIPIAVEKVAAIPRINGKRIKQHRRT